MKVLLACLIAFISFVNVAQASPAGKVIEAACEPIANLNSALPIETTKVFTCITGFLVSSLPAATSGEFALRKEIKAQGRNGAEHFLNAINENDSKRALAAFDDEGFVNALAILNLENKGHLSIAQAALEILEGK